MKTLVLMRHTEALPDRGEGDANRVLTERGIWGAQQIGEYMKRLGVRPGKVYTSSSRRTRQTLDVLKKNLDYEPEVRIDEQLYLCPMGDLYCYIKDMDNAFDNSMILSHNPGIESLSNWISESNNRFVPGGISVIQFPINTWPEIDFRRGVLKYFTAPGLNRLK